MTLLEDIKAHIYLNGIKAPVYFNFATEKQNANECIILWQYDGTPNMIARNAKIQITVKNKDMVKAEKMAVLIFDILYPIGQYKKAIEINGELMHITPLQEPFYNEKDQMGRHCYVFNINVDYSRT
jgi:hypothetical protein